ncbi:nucleoside triphosphate pyrophosphohydrolase [Mycolicibacterium pulveris]|nr:nucleoside triphosphate pyrophosphohydrolase [Mycolicibacterium pulveris]
MARRSDITGKLIRDGVAAVIAASGRTARVKTLDETAYRAALWDKLDEEVEELRRASNPNDVLEEAADILEVLVSIAETHGHTIDGLLRTAAMKRAERGRFRNRLWLSAEGPQ